MQRRLTRDTGGRLIGGVCSGLANWLGTDAVLVRLLFCFAFILFGAGPILYLILWICMPRE